jgi:hypothetical protein
MGMFDWYEPRQISCPECGTALDRWQGKDGPCALFVWREGEASPIRQAVEAEVALLPGDLATRRVPASFGIYSMTARTM